MRKLKFLTLFLVSFLSYSVTTFEKTFGDGYDGSANSIAQTSDGGYIVTGYGTDSSSVSYISILKLDPFGSEEWSKKVHSFQNEGYKIRQTDDGGYVLAGRYVYYSHGFHESIWIYKTDQYGEKEWDYKFPDDGMGCTSYDVLQTEDGGYALTGIYYFESGIVKLDSLGNEEWNKYYLNTSSGRSIIKYNSGYLIAGNTYDYDNESYDLSVTRTDSLGNEIWTKYFGSVLNEEAFSVLDLDNFIYIAGYTESFGNGGKDIYLIKSDSLGNEIWNKTYGGTADDTASSVNVTSDGNLIITGMTESFGSEGKEVWLFKTDTDGNVLWEHTFGGSGDDVANSVQQTADGGYILAGYTDSFGAGGKDTWIIKTDENGTEIKSPFLPQTAELRQNYPNPFNPSTEISYSLKTEGLVMLSVFNTKGELVRTLANEKKTAGNHSVNFNGEGLNSGIYFYKLSVDGKAVQSRKMMMLK